MWCSTLLLLIATVFMLGATPNSKNHTLRAQFLTMFARGYYPSRSGQLFVVPRQGDFISGTDSTRYYFMHGSPWEYDSAIPLLFYGPRYVRANRDARPARQQDVMPTLAAFLHLQNLPATVTGHDLHVGIKDVASSPRIVAVIVLDGMRADYLRRPQAEIPNLARLTRAATYFPNAQVDYLPTNTAVGHTTISTGTDPRYHGIVGNGMFNVVTGTKQEPFLHCRPAPLLVPTLADLWTATTRGAAHIIAQGGNVKAATALAGHGARFFNGKRVLLAAYDDSSGTWTAGDDTTCFSQPRVPRDWTALKALGPPDRIGLSLDNAKSVRHSPRFARFEGDTALSLLEGDALCGADSIPDLVLINLKTMDFVGHSYGPDSPEMRDAIAAVDSQVGRIIEVIDTKAGHDFVVAITADHGMPSGNRGESGLNQRRHVSQGRETAVRELLNSGEPDKPAQHYDGEDAQIFLVPNDPHRPPAYFAHKLRALPYLFTVFTEDEVRRAARNLH